MKHVFILLAILVAATLLGRQAVTPESAGAGTPPSDLTRYGHAVWNLEALLRSTFARRPLFIDYGASGRRANFTTRRRASYRSGYYIYTFAGAQDSAFRLLRPAAPPRPQIGASGGEVPITIRGAYVVCGSGRWVFMHFGNGPANWQISCHR
jgi:hypothetical protein